MSWLPEEINHKPEVYGGLPDVWTPELSYKALWLASLGGRGCAHSSESLENMYMDVLPACVSMHHMCARVSAGAGYRCGCLELNLSLSQANVPTFPGLSGDSYDELLGTPGLQFWTWWTVGTASWLRLPLLDPFSETAAFSSC